MDEIINFLKNLIFPEYRFDKIVSSYLVRVIYILLSFAFCCIFTYLLTKNKKIELPTIKNPFLQTKIAFLYMALIFIYISIQCYLYGRYKMVPIPWQKLIFIQLLPIFIILLLNKENPFLSLGLTFKNMKYNTIFIIPIFIGYFIWWHNKPELQMVQKYFWQYFFGVALSEELFCRGYLQTRFQVNYGSRKGLILASVIFGLAHLAHAFRGFSYISFAVIGSLISILIGLLFGFIFTKTRSIYGVWIFHAFVDLLQYGHTFK